MLTDYDEQTGRPVLAAPASGAHKPEVPSSAARSRLARAMQVEWLGQTAASLCWIASVLAYGISSSGDWLQLSAASAWLLANIASIASAEGA